jgi:hypothetical protein
MIGVEVTIDITKAVAFLDNLHPQAPFALALAMNRTAGRVNQDLQAHLEKAFTIRQRNLLAYVAPRRIPADNRATKARLQVILETEGKGRIVNPYEEGEPHTVDRFGRLVAVPSMGPGGLRPTPRTVIPRAWYPVNLGLVPKLYPADDGSGRSALVYQLGKGAQSRRLRPHRITARGKVVKQGRRRTFEIQTDRGPVILARTGPGKRDLRALWFLRTQVPRPRLLKFYDTTTAAWDRHWATELEAAWEQALRTAR